MKKIFAAVLFAAAVLACVAAPHSHAKQGISVGNVSFVLPDVQGFDLITNVSSPFLVDLQSYLGQNTAVIAAYFPTGEDVNAKHSKYICINKNNNMENKTFSSAEFETVRKNFKDAVILAASPAMRERASGQLQQRGHDATLDKMAPPETLVDNRYACSVLLRTSFSAPKNTEQPRADVISSMTLLFLRGKVFYVWVYSSPQYADWNKAFTASFVKQIYEANP